VGEFSHRQASDNLTAHRECFAYYKNFNLKENGMRNAIKVITVIMATFMCNLALADTKLSKSEVIELFSGKTVHYQLVSKNLNVVAFFDENGEARELRGNKKDNHPWWVKDNGKHCIKFKGKKKAFCRKVVKRNDGTYVKFRKGKVAVQYTSFKEGNTNNL